MSFLETALSSANVQELTGVGVQPEGEGNADTQENQQEAGGISGEGADDLKQGEQENRQNEEAPNQEGKAEASGGDSVEPSEEVKPSKFAVDYKQWLTENESTLKKYLLEKDVDYKSLSPQEAVTKKIQLDNPTYSEQDVLEELQDKYGIGLELVEIDEESMTEEEVREAKAHNKEVKSLISKGNRELKKDYLSAVEFLEQNKNVELPMFEIDLPQAEQVSPESYLQKIQEQVTQEKETIWKPQLKQAIDALESISHTVEYEYNGSKEAINLNYKLSDKQKEAVFQDLADYIVNEQDQKRFADVQGFVQAKAKEILLNDLLVTAVKEASAKGRKDFVKNDLVNFDDGVRNRGNAELEESDHAVGIWSNNRNR